MGFYYQQQPQGFYYEQPKGFYYNQQQPKGFYYNQQPKGFYYNQQPKQQGFYYSQEQPQGFYYNQEGFYYNQPQGFYYENGFYYDGFYYDSEKQSQGFYYDEQDGGHGKFNKENKDYWYKGAGKERAVAALNGLRTLVDKYVADNPHAANETQGQALSNVITVQVVREVIKKFVKNVNPADFFKNKGDAKKLSQLLVKECQAVLGPAKDFRAKWRAEGSEAKKAMDKVSNELVPFIVTWHAKHPFHTPNAIEDSACMKVVAQRLVDEASYEYFAKTDPAKLESNPEKQKSQIIFIAKNVAEACLHRIEEDLKKSK